MTSLLALNQPVRVLSRKAAEQRVPLANEVCVSITNPRQSPATLDGWAQVLRLGFHDTDGPGGNFTPMALGHARDLLSFCHVHRSVPLTIHCEFGASRSVAAGLFVAAWLHRPLELAAVNVLAPNPWVIRQLRLAALADLFRWQDWRLLQIALHGPLAYRYNILPKSLADTYAA